MNDYGLIFRPNPIEDESIRWDVDPNEAQEAAENRAYALMDAHDATFLEWLIDPPRFGGPDSGNVAKLLSLYLRGDAATTDEKIELTALAMDMRADFCRYVGDL